MTTRWPRLLRILAHRMAVTRFPERDPGGAGVTIPTNIRGYSDSVSSLGELSLGAQASCLLRICKLMRREAGRMPALPGCTRLNHLAQVRKPAHTSRRSGV
jgi:hypothetical protein